MLRRIAALVTLAALTSPAALAAQDRTPLSEYRASLMDGMSAHAGGLRAILGGEVDRPDDVIRHARALDDVTEMLLTVWPQGSGGPGTRAQVEIWQNWEDFQERINTLRAAAANLRAQAEAGNMEGVGAALRDVGQTCRSCHSDYRAREN